MRSIANPLTVSGELWLLAAATMDGMRAFGRGCRQMIRRLLADGYVRYDPIDDVYDCTQLGRAALKAAGYFHDEPEPDDGPIPDVRQKSLMYDNTGMTP